MGFTRKEKYVILQKREQTGAQIRDSSDPVLVPGVNILYH